MSVARLGFLVAGVGSAGYWSFRRMGSDARIDSLARQAVGGAPRFFQGDLHQRNGWKKVFSSVCFKGLDERFSNRLVCCTGKALRGSLEESVRVAFTDEEGRPVGPMAEAVKGLDIDVEGLEGVPNAMFSVWPGEYGGFIVDYGDRREVYFIE